jgi:hypothetical protein
VTVHTVEWTSDAGAFGVERSLVGLVGGSANWHVAHLS